MACLVSECKQNLRMGVELRRGARLYPSPEGCPEGARVEPCPTAEEFLCCPALHEARARKAVIFSLGVNQPKHFLGRSFRNVSIRLSCAWPIPANDDFLG